MNPVSAAGANSSGCGRVVYHDKVRMLDNATGTAASFKTAFTFSFLSFTTDLYCGDGMVFSFYKDSDIGDPKPGGAGGYFCVFNTSAYSTEPVFAVEIDSYYNTWPNSGIPFSDKSDSHISVDLWKRKLDILC